MTLPHDADQPPLDPCQSAGRRGRKPAPISGAVGLSHRAWLEPVRGVLFASGMTLNELVDRSGYSKTRISELLRGNDYYPAWEITFSVIRVLGLPGAPMRRLWAAAAREARKERGWIEHCLQQVALQPERPPVAHQAFTKSMGAVYTDYARAFLLTDERARGVVTEVFDLLWLRWSETVSSENARRYAWRLLRSRVMARANRHADGRPDLRTAAFSTAEVHDSIHGHDAAVIELVDLFDAIGHLPDDQMDVVVLRFLCAMVPKAVPDVLGLSQALTHAIEHHARATLERLFHPHGPRE